MLVRVCETVDIETEVEVGTAEVLSEFSARFDEAESKNVCLVKFAYLPLVDFATKLLARIPLQAIEKCTDKQREEVSARLWLEARRWASKPKEVADGN